MPVGKSDYFQEAFNEYRAEIAKKPKKKDFIGEIELSNANASPEELQKTVETLVKECGDKKLRQFWKRYLTPVIDNLEELSGVIDTAVSSVANAPQGMPVALVWGSIKFMLRWARNFNNIFEQIQSELETLADQIRRLASCEIIYSVTPYTAPSVQKILARSYKTILMFWYRVVKELKRSSIRQLARAVFPSGKLKKIIDQLTQDAEQLDRVCNVAEKELQHASRERVENIDGEVTKARVEAAIEAAAAAEERRLNEARWNREDEQQQEILAKLKEESASRMRHERETRRRQAMDSIRGDSSRSSNLLQDMIRERHHSSCGWLLDSQDFQRWVADECDTPVFWLNGRHGGGKTFLCAAAIERIRGDPHAHCTAVEFLKKGIDVSRNRLFRNLAYQMTKSLERMTADVPDHIIELIEECKDDAVIVETLLCRLFEELGRTFVFLDGLDEAPNTPDVPYVVDFLIHVAAKIHGVRIWCSSQPLRQIEEYMKTHSDCILEKAMTIADTEADIKSYWASTLADSVGGRSEFAEALVKACMEEEVKGSFLWASSMISDLKDKAEDAEDIIRLVARGLPTRMDDIYRNIIEDYKKEDFRSKSRHPKVALWKIILSLLAFSKRPLRLNEIREAIAMLRSGPSEDLSTFRFVSLTSIRKECSRLVRFIKAGESEEDGTLELNHSSVYTFLREDAKAEDIVSSSFIADCCLGYLWQPRYAKLLRKRSPSVFHTWTGKDVSSHQLLLYAAKYWYRHCDEREMSPDFCSRVRRFLMSSNFHTCIQVQSISIIGHFLLSFNPITEQPTRIKKNLPDCASEGVAETDGVQILPQYNNFLYEWTEFLQHGLTAEMNGEIDRCFWKALGPLNFLRQGQEKYHSFHFWSPYLVSKGMETASKICFFSTPSFDGSELSLCRVEPSKIDEDDSRHICVERWRIDGKTDPYLLGNKLLTVSCKNVQWSLYSTPCARKLPLLPESASDNYPESVALLDSGGGLRIGSRIWLQSNASRGAQYAPNESNAEQPSAKSEGIPESASRDREKVVDDSIGSTQTKLRPDMTTSIDTPVLTEFCEEIARRSNLLVICRRRIPKATTSSSHETENERIHYAKNRSAELIRRQYRHHNSDSGSGSHVDDSHYVPSPVVSPRPEDDRAGVSGVEMEQVFSDTQSLASKTSDSSEQSNPMGSEMHSAPSSDKESVTTNHEASDFDTRSNSVESYDSVTLSAENTDLCDSDEQDLDSLLSYSSSETSEDVFHEGALNIKKNVHKERLSGEDMNEGFEYPVSITNLGLRVGSPFCDLCFRYPNDHWYGCNECITKNTYDLCQECFKTGAWCFDKKHQLYERMAGFGVVRIHSWNAYTIGQEIMVYDTDTTMEKPIFTHCKVDGGSLHRSAPIIHPQLPLVVWPICAEKLLFADTSQKKCYSIQPFKASSRKAIQISIDLFCSPCGTYLYVGSVEALPRKISTSAPRPPPLSRGSSTQKEKSQELSFHLTTLRLSTTNPAKTRPVMISRQCHGLGIWNKPYVSMLPYSWTWTPEAAYFTMTGFKLRVYCLALPSPGTKSLRAPITTPTETILLPHSARDRSVQFFPPNKSPPAIQNPTSKNNYLGSSRPKSIVIIGPRYKPTSEPPIGVYLSEKDLGPWVDVREKEDERRMKGPRRRFTGAFEEFDEDDDCDIIPFDGWR